MSGPEWLALLNLGAFLGVCVSILTGLWMPSLPVAGALAAGELVLALAAIAWLIATPSAEDTGIAWLAMFAMSKRRRDMGA